MFDLNLLFLYLTALNLDVAFLIQVICNSQLRTLEHSYGLSDAYTFMVSCSLTFGMKNKDFSLKMCNSQVFQPNSLHFLRVRVQYWCFLCAVISNTQGYLEFKGWLVSYTDYVHLCLVSFNVRH